MPDIALNYDYRLEINTTPEGESETMAEIAEGFNSITESLNEVVQQFSFFGDGGYGSSFVTGGQLTVTLSGVRMKGDPAQDYMFSDAVLYNWGKARETTCKLYCPDGDVISCPVTLAKINRSGGESQNGTAVSLEIHFNGKPEVETQKQ
ncbi:MAG: capsid protein [Ruminococcus sp.]|nr:capsid protein [Ruminococcus sp.]